MKSNTASFIPFLASSYLLQVVTLLLAVIFALLRLRPVNDREPRNIIYKESLTYVCFCIESRDSRSSHLTSPPPNLNAPTFLTTAVSYMLPIEYRSFRSPDLRSHFYSYYSSLTSRRYNKTMLNQGTKSLSILTKGFRGTCILPCKI